MGFATIIALDLGKFKTVACVMDVATRTHAFETIDMSPKAVHDLLARHAAAAPGDTLVVFETCDTAGWVHDLCTALGTSIVVANANDERWRWRRVKRKTDRDDALKLARLALLDQLGAVHMPDPPARQRRRLMLHRRSVVSRRTQSRNAVRARSSTSRACRWPRAASSGRSPASRSCASTQGRSASASTRWTCGVAACRSNSTSSRRPMRG